MIDRKVWIFCIICVYSVIFLSWSSLNITSIYRHIFTFTFINAPNSELNTTPNKQRDAILFSALTTNYTAFGFESEDSRNEYLELQEEMSCQLPLLNPVDPSNEGYYIDLPFSSKMSCANVPGENYPLLFTTDLRSTLIQIDDPAKYGYYFCCYSPFTRSNGSEYSVDVSEECYDIKNKETKIPSDIEFITISCTNHSTDENGPSKIIDMFGFIPMKVPSNSYSSNKVKPISESKPTLESKLNESGKMESQMKRNVNVVMFGIDSVSHLGLIRSMPLTYKYLTKNLSAEGLWGYTKVGLNTFPNIVPALTGLTPKELNTAEHCWGNSSEPFDDCPFIWKEFASQGYATAFGEDAVFMGIFNFLKGGFDQQPTDYYFHTLTHQQHSNIGHTKPLNSYICYGPRYGFEVLLDFVKKMAVVMTDRQRRYFQFIWATSLTHDYLAEANICDRFVFETLQWLESKGYLKDTVFILMSDHGFHLGPFESTNQGKVEDRMPFMYFVLPQWFRELYPSAVRNLRRNKYRLTTAFDIHETLKDLVNLERIEPEKIKFLDRIVNSGSTIPRGISLFLPIPLKRTCADAAIPRLYCLCDRFDSVELENNSLVIEAATSVVRSINELFSNVPQCLPLKFLNIINAKVYRERNNTTNKYGKGYSLADVTDSLDPRLAERSIRFRIALTVSPSNATFDSTTTRLTDGRWEVDREISRTNIYGNQSLCVNDYSLKPFCFCG